VIDAMPPHRPFIPGDRVVDFDLFDQAPPGSQP
jgi:hypothetical protein